MFSVCFATCKVFILNNFRDFDYLYENNLQIKRKQFRLFSYLYKFIKSLKVLTLCVLSATVLIFATRTTWLLFWVYSTALMSIFPHYFAYFCTWQHSNSLDTTSRTYVKTYLEFIYFYKTIDQIRLHFFLLLVYK